MLGIVYIVIDKIKTQPIIRVLLLAVLHLVLDYFLSFTVLHLVFNLTEVIFGIPYESLYGRCGTSRI